MDDNGYDDDGDYELISDSETIVQRDAGPYVAVHKRFVVNSDSALNTKLLLDPMDVLTDKFSEIRPNFRLTVTRTNAHIPRKGPHRAIWELTIIAEAKQVDAKVTRVPPAPAP